MVRAAVLTRGDHFASSLMLAQGRSPASPDLLAPAGEPVLWAPREPFATERRIRLPVGSQRMTVWHVSDMALGRRMLSLRSKPPAGQPDAPPPLSTQFRPAVLQWVGGRLGLVGALLGEHPNYRGFWMLDEPRLGAARELLMAPFRPTAVNDLDARISETCRTVLEERLQAGTDLLDVADYCNDVLFRLMAHLLGARPDTAPAIASMFRGWMQVFNTSPSLASLRWQPGIYAGVARMIREHHGGPGVLADIQSALRRRDSLGGRRPATMADYVGLVWALIAAGTDTPATVAAQSVWFTVLHGSFPELTLRSAAAPAVAEALRYYPPFTRPLARWTGDYPIAPGVVARRGEWVELHLPAMNRDPGFFSQPDVYDPRRRDSAAARTFGGGAHRCIGNHYGSRVAEHILVTLARRLPGLAPVAGHPYRRHGGLLHRLDHLPMRT